AIDGLRDVRVFEETGDIVKPEEVAIAEQGPALKAGKRRRQKARIGEFRRRQWIDVPAIKALGAQVVEFDGGDGNRHGCAPLEGELGNLIGFWRAGVPIS